MTLITGVITEYLELLTLPQEDPAVEQMLAKQAGRVKTSTYRSPFAHYKTFPEAGTIFLFDKEGLSAVFFKMQPSPAFGELAFPADPPLVDGLQEEPDMLAVRALLGEAYANNEDYYDAYKAGEKQFVHFEYGSEDEVRQVTIMHTLPSDR